METIGIELEKNLLDEAMAYAKKQGVDLSFLLRDYLSRLVKQQDRTEDEIPDVVESLLGAGEHVADNDLGAREAYHRYQEKKH